MGLKNTAQKFGNGFNLGGSTSDSGAPRPLDSYIALANAISKVEASGKNGAFLVEAKMANPFQEKAIFGIARHYGSVAEIYALGVEADDTITVNGLEYTAVAGVKSDFTEFSIDGTDNDVAIDIADSINNDERVGTSGKVKALAETSIIHLYQIEDAGNATTLASSNGTRLDFVAFSGASSATGTVTCASVLAGDTVTINGLVYTAVNGAKADNTEFNMAGNDTADAADLAASINADTRVGDLGDVVATSALGVVTVEQVKTVGEAGNATTLASSNATRLAVSGATLSGALDQTYIDFKGNSPIQNFEPVQKTPNPTALSSGRAINISVSSEGGGYVETNGRAFRALLNYIQKVENKYEALGGDASADTATDLSDKVVVVRGATPGESYTFTVSKTDADYTVVVND